MTNLRFLLLAMMYFCVVLSASADVSASDKAKKLVQLMDLDRFAMLTATDIIFWTRPKWGDQQYISFVTCVDSSDMTNLRAVIASILDKKLSTQELEEIGNL